MSASPVKAKKAAKPRKAADHPKYIEMICKAINELKERGGSSRVKILKYLVANFKVDPANANQHLKVSLRNGVKSGALKQTKGVGAAGSFKVGEKKAAKKPKKVVKKKVAAKKPKKVVAKKPAGEKKAAKPKKAKSPKKVKKPKSPKKAKTPKKAAAKKPVKAKKAAKKSPKKAAKKAAKK